MYGPQPRVLPLFLLLLRTPWDFDTRYSEQSNCKCGRRLDFGCLGGMKRGEDREKGFEGLGLRALENLCRGAFLHKVLFSFMLGFSSMFLITHL